MKMQRKAARDELRAFKAMGVYQERITAPTKKPEGDGPDIDAIRATRGAKTPAEFRRATRARGLLHIPDSRPATP